MSFVSIAQMPRDKASPESETPSGPGNISGNRVSTSKRMARYAVGVSPDGGSTVGMVGTSGALHQGHLSLIRRAAEENDVAALFWGGHSVSDWMESELGYERDAGRDFALAEEAGLDIVFAPDNAELFPREPMTTVSLPATRSIPGGAPGSCTISGSSAAWPGFST